MNETDRQKIKDDVQAIFIERNRNTIAEKISDLTRVGFTEDEARHVLIQAVKNLPNYLLPLKATTANEDMISNYKLTELVKHSPFT